MKALAFVRFLLRALGDALAASRHFAAGETKRGAERLVRLCVAAVEHRKAVRFTDADLKALTEAAEDRYKEHKAAPVLFPMRHTGRAIAYWASLWHPAAGAQLPRAQLLASGFPEHLLPQ